MSDETVQRNISESADKIRVETQVKRGEGTRDEDRIKVKVKGDDPEAVVAKLQATVENLRETGETLRAMQPSGEADE
jgi:hypothetical protein